MYQFMKNGKRHSKSGFATKDDAIIAQAKARKNIVKIDTDFARLCESRLDDLKARRSDKYYKENLKLIEILQTRWEGKRKITRQDIKDYLWERIEKSKTSANKELRFIKALFNHGLEEELIEENPVLRIKYFDVKKKRKYIPPKEDVDKVLAQVNDELLCSTKNGRFMCGIMQPFFLRFALQKRQERHSLKLHDACFCCKKLQYTRTPPAELLYELHIPALEYARLLIC
jgi:hypothetical protein